MYIFKICVCVVETILKCVETHQIPISQCLCLCLCILFFSLIFVPFNLCVFFSCVTSFDSIFYCNFWCENVDAKREKVLIKPKIFSYLLELNRAEKNVRKCKHITWLFIWWFWPFNLSSILSFRCCCFFACLPLISPKWTLTHKVSQKFQFCCRTTFLIQ